MTAFKEFAIGKFVLRFYKTDHVWTCTVTEGMLDEVSKELALQRLSDIGQAIEQEPVAWKHKPSGMIFDEIIEAANPDDLVPLYTHLAKTLNFFEISIDDKYVIRIYKSGIYESELGNLSAKMPIEEWNEHAKNVKEILKKANEK
jgi:uncharacterized Zn finger protein